MYKQADDRCDGCCWLWPMIVDGFEFYICKLDKDYDDPHPITEEDGKCKNS